MVNRIVEEEIGHVVEVNLEADLELTHVIDTEVAEVNLEKKN